MAQPAKTYGDLLIERHGRGFSEQKLIEVLREVLPELAALHATQQAHGHISPEALIQNSETQQTTLKPAPAQAPWDQDSSSKDLYDLGATIIILLTGKPLKSFQGPDGLYGWQDDRLVSDDFANMINKATARIPELRYASAMSMLQDLDEQEKPNASPSLQDLVTHDPQAQVFSQVGSIQPTTAPLPSPHGPFIESQGSKDTSSNQRILQSGRIVVMISAALLGAALTVLASFLYQHFRPQSQAATGIPELSGNLNASPTTNPPQTPAGDTTADQATFTGINLPITNRLCTNRGNFCIYNLAGLINRESGQATYSFSEMVEGQLIKINGTISIANLQKENGKRIFTFSFRDDQNTTSPGWAAAGSFRLDQDTTKPGIMTRFKTTESFGPKTPMGLENTAYVFPR
jgi:serine/threonine protein kinase